MLKHDQLCHTQLKGTVHGAALQALKVELIAIDDSMLVRLSDQESGARQVTAQPVARFFA